MPEQTPLELAQQELAVLQAQETAVDAHYNSQVLQLPYNYQQRKRVLAERIAVVQQNITVLESEQ